MNYQFNYKEVHFYLLSFFGLLIFLSLIGSINSSDKSDFIMKYSIFGIVICLVSWHIESKIISEANAITGEIIYSPDLDDFRIHNKLNERNKNREVLLITLIPALFVSILLPSMWLLIYLIFGCIYWYLLTTHKLI
jgi:hypothetical protein